MRLTRKQFFGVVAGAAAATTTAGTSVDSLEALAGQGPAAVNKKKLEGAAIKGATEAVTKFITTASLKGIPAGAVEQAKRCLIDGFGVILAGSTVRGSAIVREYAKSISDRKEATALGNEKLMAPAALAALVNGASGHAMDYDGTPS
jgi:hypothetical protein